MSTLRIDLETYSDVDLKKCGVHRYVESPSFEILLLAFAFDDEPVSVVDLARGESIGGRVLDALVAPDVTKTAFNAQFEIACLGRHLSRATATGSARRDPTGPASDPPLGALALRCQATG